MFHLGTQNTQQKGSKSKKDAFNSNNQVTTSKGATAVPKFKKAPDAPKRFKSAFIIFSAEKHKEIKEDLAQQGRAEKVSRSFDRREVIQRSVFHTTSNSFLYMV